jgi:hypothetical protein
MLAQANHLGKVQYLLKLQVRDAPIARFTDKFACRVSSSDHITAN